MDNLGPETPVDIFLPLTHGDGKVLVDFPIRNALLPLRCGIDPDRGNDTVPGFAVVAHMLHQSTAGILAASRRSEWFWERLKGMGLSLLGRSLFQKPS